MPKEKNSHLLDDLQTNLENKIIEHRALEKFIVENQNAWGDYVKEVTNIRLKTYAYEIELIKQRISELS